MAWLSVLNLGLRACLMQGLVKSTIDTHHICTYTVHVYKSWDMCIGVCLFTLGMRTMYLVQDLVEDLKSELSGDFEELILALMMTPLEYEAYCLNDALRGLGTDEAALLGMLLTRTPQVQVSQHHCGRHFTCHCIPVRGLTSEFVMNHQVCPDTESILRTL